MAEKVREEKKKGGGEPPPRSPPLRHAIGKIVESQRWLDKLATPSQNWLLKLFGQPGQSNRKIKDLLNGTWLGHPLHPVLTDVPLGTWTGMMMLDLVQLNNEDEGIARASDILLALGIAGATGAAVAGATDWSDLADTDRRVGMVHGLLNGSALLTNIAALVLRLTGKRPAGMALPTIGYLTSLCAAYLGGELAFAKGIGGNHESWEGGPGDYVPFVVAKDLAERKLTGFDA